MNKRKCGLLTCAAAMSLITAVTAQAQATPPPAAQPADGDQGSAPQPAADNGVGDIIVTAQRRSENLQKVPIVVTALNNTQLTRSGVVSLPTLSLVAPGLNSRTSGGGVFQPSIRGIGTSSNVVENPVALYIDGVYLANQNESNRELPDVEQIAVLKGPQGTLFGRNSTGGVIQITTKRPTQEFSGQVKAEIDNYATLRTGAYLTGGVAKDLAASISVDYATQGRGWGTNLVTGNDTFKLAHSLSLRGKLLYEPDADTSLMLIGDYMDRKQYTYTFVPYPGTTFVGPATRLAGKQDTASPIDPYAAYHGGGVSLTAEHRLSFAKLTSITAYRQGTTSYLFDDAPSGTPIFYVGVAPGNQPNKSFSEELQLSSVGNGPVKYTFGVFYFFNRNSNSPVFRDFFPTFYGATNGPPTANQSTLTYGSEKTQSVAPFGQMDITLLKDTTLTLGARYTYEKRELVGNALLNLYNGNTINVNYNPAPLTINKPTWRAALSHQFTSTVLGYVSYNRGIKSGGFNILTPSNPAYLPEKLDAYEAGFKTELFGRRLRLNAGGFYYNYDNLQVTQFVGVSQTVVNGARARLYGLDVDFNAKLTSEFSLSGGFEMLHAHFTSYPNAVGSIPKATGGATLISVDASGNRIPQSQKFVGTLALDYEKQFSSGTFHANVTGNYNGNYKFEADNFLTQGAYTLLNSSLSWQPAHSALTVSIWGRNLLNAIVLNNATSQAIGYPVSYGQPPRTFGVTGKVTF
ncbi:TonB-dependent receptor [Novosphingobium terrae]|uniref:TonB-dependent receptor n=1 Tax=Novosphingobium terrae TaxID=2726189 RepID=UPI00197D3378|nr:TonB-dependent receptor [Novosphingobium terrae]